MEKKAKQEKKEKRILWAPSCSEVEQGLTKGNRVDRSWKRLR